MLSRYYNFYPPGKYRIIATDSASKMEAICKKAGIPLFPLVELPGRIASDSDSLMLCLDGLTTSQILDLLDRYGFPYCQEMVDSLIQAELGHSGRPKNRSVQHTIEG